MPGQKLWRQRLIACISSFTYSAFSPLHVVKSISLSEMTNRYLCCLGRTPGSRSNCSCSLSGEVSGFLPQAVCTPFPKPEGASDPSWTSKHSSAKNVTQNPTCKSLSPSIRETIWAMWTSKVHTVLACPYLSS